MILKTNRSSTEILFLIIYYTICLGLCLYQIFTISELYFAYKTTTSVKYDNISMISLPAITLCFDKNEVLRENTLNKSENNFLHLMANETIKDQFKMLYEFWEIFNLCILIMQNESIHDLSPNQTENGCELTGIEKSIDFNRSIFIFNQKYQLY